MRVLIGWMPEPEGAFWLGGQRKGCQLHAPHIMSCRQARLQVGARSGLRNEAPIFGAVPDSLKSYLTGLLAGPVGGDLQHPSRRFCLADLRLVRAAQVAIFTDKVFRPPQGFDRHDLAALAQITLPCSPEAAVNVVFNAPKNAWVLTSDDENLRLAGRFRAIQGDSRLGFGFVVDLLTSFVRIAGCDGRYFLLDGYHRAVGLLEAGVTWAPVLVEEFDAFEEVPLPNSFLSSSAYLGSKAPFLADYFSDVVSARAVVPDARKTIVIQGWVGSSSGP